MYAVFTHNAHVANTTLRVLLAERGTNVKVPTVQCSGVSMAIHYADEVLSTRDFTVDGQARAMITSITNPGTSTYASFEVSFIAGWAHCQKNQYPELSTRVQDFIAQCWRTGEESNVEASAVKSHLKVSAEAVQAQLASQYTDGLLLFSEVLWSVKFEQCTKKLNNTNIQSMNRGSGVESASEMRAFARSGQRIPYQWMRLTGLQRILVISSLQSFGITCKSAI